jgi:hypothetical protein
MIFVAWVLTHVFGRPGLYPWVKTHATVFV